MIEVTLHQSLADNVCLGVMQLTDIRLPDDDGDALWQEIEKRCETLRKTHAGKTVGQVPGVANARKLYRSIGIDPTKTRPSSEALLRRVLKGNALYRVHPLVDLFNLVSLERLTPVGLYDESKLEGDEVTVRIGEEGEGYEGIRKPRVNLGGRFLIADAKGPFGSPTSDSMRTAVEGTVTSALAVFFQQHGIPEATILDTIARAEALAATYLGARIGMKTVIGH